MKVCSPRLQSGKSCPLWKWDMLRHGGRRDGDKGTGAGPRRGEERGRNETPPLPSVTFHLHYLHYSDSPPGPSPAWTTFPWRCHAEITCWQSNQWEPAQSLQMSFLSSSRRVGGFFSLPRPHPERSRSSKPIQKCPIIIDLSVLIFINNCACDDPAGMLMSPRLELISCGRRSGRLSIPPWSSAAAAVKQTLPALCSLWWGRWTIRPNATWLSSSVSPLGFIKKKVLPQQNLLFFSQSLCPLASALLRTIPSLN